SPLRLLLEGAPAELDERALSVFLRLGFFLGEDTAFTAIKALPPAATMRWRAGRLELRGSRPPPPPPADLGRSEAIEQYAALFRASIERCLEPGDDIVLPLSGGRDSRHILLELLR